MTLWMIWTWIWLFGVKISECHSSSSSSSWTRLWGEFEIVKINLWNSAKQFFSEIGKLVRGQTETTCFNTIDAEELTWMSTTLLCEKAYQITNAKTNVFSDSVLCEVKMRNDPIATWKSKIQWYSENNHFKDMNRIDGMPLEFERKIFPRTPSLGLLEKIQSLMRDLHCEPEHYTDRIVFMSMYKDIAWDEEGNHE